MEEAGEMPVAGTGEAGQLGAGPGFGGIFGDGVLHAMHSGMNGIAYGQPRRDLRVRTSATQIDHEVSRDGRRAGVSHQAADEVEHEVDACSNAGRGVEVGVVHEEPVVEHLRARCDARETSTVEMMRGAAAAVE